MQPYLLPYIGYFGLVQAVDQFVILDSVQYIRRGWINRNRIPETQTSEGWIYFGVPVRKAPRETKIQSIELAFEEEWQETLKKTVFQKYSNTPYFEKVLPLLTSLFDPPRLIRDMNIDLLRQISAYLGLKPSWILSSELSSRNESLESLTGSNLIVGLCQIQGAGAYWNLPGGKVLYQEKDFENVGIDLRFIPTLDELPEGPIPKSRLQWSILDVIMRHSIEEIQETLSGFTKTLGQ
jgi:hypothetical protein